MKNIDVYTRVAHCPFCENAKDLLKSKGLVFTEIKISSPEQLPKPEFRTVPQIVIDGEFLGGFKELEAHLRNTAATKVVEPSTKTTVFNKNNTGYVTGKYPLFLGEEMGFADSINNPYPVIDDLYDQQMAQIWNHTEVDLTQDRQDMLSAPPEIVDLMVQNLTWQTLADSVASRAIGSVLTKYVSNSSLQDLYNAIILFESIHSKTYLHIIRQTFVDPNEALRQGYANVQAIKRSDILVDSFDNLANCSDVTQQRKLVLFCVVAMYLLERVNFMSSFACTFAIAERGYFQGISQDVILICRDEILHAKAGKTILGILKAQWPGLFEELKPELAKIIDAVEQDEFAFNNYLFSNGRQVIGLNANLLNDYVRYNMVEVRNSVLGTTLPALPNPLPYMENYIDTSRVQSAAQEIQLTAYLVNSVKASTEEEINTLLTKLRAKYL